MRAEDPHAKWDRIYSGTGEAEPQPAQVLEENAHLLPAKGHALDLACGLGGNALFLARRGLMVSAWDISNTAVGRLAALGAKSGLPLKAEVRDVEAEPFPREAFHVVVISRFLSRQLANPIIDSLKPGGLLFYQTFVRDKVISSGPSNADYLLKENELLALFSGLRVLVYREEGRIGDLSAGRRDEAFFVGCKR